MLVILNAMILTGVLKYLNERRVRSLGQRAFLSVKMLQRFKVLIEGRVV